jgi:hypothetical protein
MFFLDLCLFVTNRYVAAATHQSYDDRLAYAAMAIGVMFVQFSKMPFMTFGSIGSVAREVRIDLFSNFIWPEIESDAEHFGEIAKSWQGPHVGNEPSNKFSPYIREKSPNIFSPLHLIAQSLCERHVCDYCFRTLTI